MNTTANEVHKHKQVLQKYNINYVCKINNSTFITKRAVCT